MAIVETSAPIATTSWDTEAVSAVQQRTVGILAAIQILGGLGTGSVAAVGALLAADLATESLSGLSSAGSTVGAALIAIPVTRLMQTQGRRQGLQMAYVFGVLGTLIVILGTVLKLFPLALVGLILTGGGQTAGLQSRYAATDLATAQRRGRSLATVVWATTIGSVVGPNLASPMGRVAESIHVPKLAGPYLLTGLVFGVACVLVGAFLRPDPLQVSREVRAAAGDIHATRRPVHRSIVDSFGIIRANPAALLGFCSVVVGHMVMVSIMSMTPVHLKHDGNASLTIVGYIISAHICGMYIASPLVGIGVDRYGRRPVMLVGAVILLAACAFAGTASGHQTVQLGIGLWLLGLGWSCTLISGSTLLTESVSPEDRPAAQGATDLLMGIAGAGAALGSGLVVGLGSYGLLTIVATLLIIPFASVALRPSILGRAAV